MMTTASRPSLWEEARVLGRSLRMAVSSPVERARRIYELYSPDNKLTEESHYLNMGYWLEPDATLDQASEALVDLVAEHGRFGPGQRILDVGFGYGDQDFRWLERFPGATVVGVNVTPQQVRLAGRRAVERGLADRAEFREGSATEAAVPPASVDRVVALESSFHFVSREDFFLEAFTALRPGGVLVTADIVPLDLSGGAERGKGMGSFTYMIPDENWYDVAAYEKLLRRTGFTDVRLTSIREHVWEPWFRYASRRVNDPGFRAGVSRIYHSTLRRHLANEKRWKKDFANLDFTIAVAVKPAA
jgi:erythromycin 3''-O-methyltransferase